MEVHQVRVGMFCTAWSAVPDSYMYVQYDAHVAS